MTILLIALFLAVYALFPPSADGGDHGFFDHVLDGATVFLLGYAVVGGLLAVPELYHPVAVSSLLLVALLFQRWRQGASLGRSRKWLDRSILGYVLVAALALPVLVDRFEFFEMFSDPGVYINSGRNLAVTGGTNFQRPIPPGFGPTEKRIYETLTDYRKDRFTPGIICQPDCHFQFYPGWPAVLALGVTLFGFLELHNVLLVVALLVVYRVYRLCGRWMTDWRRVLAALVFAVNPLFVYFAKFPTSEMFLLLAVLFITDTLLEGRPHHRNLALLGIAALAVSHISLFLYLPLLVLFGLWAARQRPHLVPWYLGATALFILSLPFGYLASPVYFHNIFEFAFPSDRVPALWWPVLLGLGAAGWAAGMLVLRRWQRAQEWLGRLEPALEPALRLWFLAILGWFTWTAYRLGWTDHYQVAGQAYAKASWSLRLDYAGTGWGAVSHLNLVSIALGTGIALFVVFVVLVLWPRHRLVRDTFDLIALVGILSTLSLYTFLLFDMPTNYYYSRYFLPVLVPLVMLYALRRLGSARPWLFVGVMVLSLAFAARYTPLLVREPAYQGRVDMARWMKGVIPEGSVVFVAGEPQRELRLLLPMLIHYDLRSSYMYLGPELHAFPGRFWINHQRIAPSAGPVFVVTGSPLPHPLPPALPAYEEVGTYTLRDRFYPLGTEYPRRSNEVERSFYVYRFEPPETRRSAAQRM